MIQALSIMKENCRLVAAMAAAWLPGERSVRNAGPPPESVICA